MTIIFWLLDSPSCRELDDRAKQAGIKRTTPAGLFSPKGDSPIGPVDMTGNIWEWCSTLWGHKYPYVANDGRKDLGGGDDFGRVVRGSSWYDDRTWGRCARRLGYNPRDWLIIGGLRCVCATSSPLLGPEP